jgi:hypothetical protein
MSIVCSGVAGGETWFPVSHAAFALSWPMTERISTAGRYSRVCQQFKAFSRQSSRRLKVNGFTLRAPGERMRVCIR